MLRIMVIVVVTVVTIRTLELVIMIDNDGNTLGAPPPTLQ